MKLSYESEDFAEKFLEDLKELKNGIITHFHDMGYDKVGIDDLCIFVSEDNRIFAIPKNNHEHRPITVKFTDD